MSSFNLKKWLQEQRKIWFFHQVDEHINTLISFIKAGAVLNEYLTSIWNPISSEYAILRIKNYSKAKKFIN